MKSKQDHGMYIANYLREHKVGGFQTIDILLSLMSGIIVYNFPYNNKSELNDLITQINQRFYDYIQIYENQKQHGEKNNE